VGLDDVTRPVFQELPEGIIALFYVLSFITLGFFFFGLNVRVRKFRAAHGRYPFPLRSLPSRLWSSFWAIAAHTTIGRDDFYVRLAHFLTFWGFAILFISTVILTVDYDLARRIYPQGFWRGPFFLGYEVFSDTGGVLLIVGVVMLMVRRWVIRPFRLGYGRVDLPPERYSRADYARGDALFLVFLLALALSGFLLEGARIRADGTPFPGFSYVGQLVAVAIAAAGASPAAAETIRAYAWWAHALAALAFIAVLPYGKGVHMFLDIATLVLRDPAAGRRLSDPVPSA
jgi:nitrate reductase gamma subunit